MAKAGSKPSFLGKSPPFYESLGRLLLWSLHFYRVERTFLLFGLQHPLECQLSSDSLCGSIISSCIGCAVAQDAVRHSSLISIRSEADLLAGIPTEWSRAYISSMIEEGVVAAVDGCWRTLEIQGTCRSARLSFAQSRFFPSRQSRPGLNLRNLGPSPCCCDTPSHNSDLINPSSLPAMVRRATCSEAYGNWAPRRRAYYSPPPHCCQTCSVLLYDPDGGHDLAGMGANPEFVWRKSEESCSQLRLDAARRVIGPPRGRSCLLT